MCKDRDAAIKADTEAELTAEKRSSTKLGPAGTASLASALDPAPAPTPGPSRDTRAIPSQRLVYDQQPREASGFFYLSNELDWPGLVKPKGKWVSQNDVEIRKSAGIIAFSNNVGWDQVIESDAEVLVLCDWMARPLEYQENVFGPLIHESSSPAEFLSNTRSR